LSPGGEFSLGFLWPHAGLERDEETGKKAVRGEHKKGKYKFSQADHVNKILLCWWFSLIVSEMEFGERFALPVKRRNQTKLWTFRPPPLFGRLSEAVFDSRLTYSDGFLMNQQI
jgi:hypothetical protein